MVLLWDTCSKLTVFSSDSVLSEYNFGRLSKVSFVLAGDEVHIWENGEVVPQGIKRWSLWLHQTEFPRPHDRSSGQQTGNERIPLHQEKQWDCFTYTCISTYKYMFSLQFELVITSLVYCNLERSDANFSHLSCPKYLYMYMYNTCIF